MKEQSFYPPNGDILSRANLYKFIREYFRASSYGAGYYLEFGVFNGEATIDAYRKLRGYITHYYGFDSFAGLPEITTENEDPVDLMPGFSPGLMKSMPRDQVEQTLLAMTAMEPDTLTLTEGFFSESLKAFDTSRFADKGPCHVCYVDCDLYSSSMEVFEFIEPLIETGTWILLDDYWAFRGDPRKGQRKAFEDWLAKSDRVGASEYCNFKGWGKAFIAYVK